MNEPRIWSGLDLGSLSLVVAWFRGTRLHYAAVPLTVEVADTLRESCRATLRSLDEREYRNWSSDAANEPDEYLLASFDQIGNDSEIMKMVRARDFDTLSARELPKQSFVCYAIVAGPVERRITFIRKYNPRRGLGRKLVTAFNDTLSKITDPLFTFDDWHDVVVDLVNGVAILGLPAFEMLFRSSPEMVARAPEYVGKIAASLPMSKESCETLADLASTNMSVHRRLQSITQRGHLDSIPISAIAKELRRHDLDAKKFLVNGTLAFDRADAKEILKLLNEDLFRGGLTNQDFQVDRKSPH